jgi:hypothetical protein
MQVNNKYFDFNNSKVESLVQESPVGYNGGQVDKPVNFFLSIDYLILNLSAPIIESVIEKNTSKYFSFEKQKYTTRIFKHVFKVDFLGKKLGTLTFTPLSPILKSDFVQLQLENNFFYEYNSTELHDLLLELFKHLGAQFAGVNRLDISLDFDISNKKFFNPSDLLKEWETGKTLLGGRPKTFNIYYEVQEGKRTMNGFAIGKRGSEKFLRCYNKSLELLKNPKYYIDECHKKNGLDSDQIWRIEYQLSGKFMASLIGMEFYRLFIPTYQLEIFQLATSNHFVWRKNEGRTEVNKNPEIPTIDFHYLKNIVRGIYLGVDREKRQKMDNPIESAKRLLKGCFREYYKDQTNLISLTNFSRVLNDYNLGFFVDKKLDFWIAEFDKKSYLTSGFNYAEFQNDFLTVQNCEI